MIESLCVLWMTRPFLLSTKLYCPCKLSCTSSKPLELSKIVCSLFSMLIAFCLLVV